MSKIFYPTAEKLTFLLECIHNRLVALPDFQRDFVWEPRETEELIESICQNFPAGSLLRIKNSAGFYFAPREFAGSPELDGHSPAYLVLDGQQRLTSLYQAFYGSGSHRYFADLQGLLDDQDLEDCVFYLRRNEADRRFGSVQHQAEGLVFPFERLSGSSGGFEEWLDTILELRTEKGDDSKELKASLRGLYKTWLKPVEDYEFPMVTLAEDTSASAVCTIFETLNRTGVKLSVFDLLTARFWPADVKLRDLWERAQDDYPIIADFGIDPYYILQAVSIFATDAAPSCKRSDVLKLSVDQIGRGWAPVVAGLAEALTVLKNDCGVLLPQFLPYYTMLVPSSAALAAMQGTSGPGVGIYKSRFKRWFWCSVFGQAYENAPNSQSSKDYLELTRWMRGGPEPQTVMDFSFDVESLRLTTVRQRAVYRGVMALALRHGARDFHQGDKITARAIADMKMDDHHIFPQAYLAEKRPDISAAARDCVLNRTLIDEDTNRRIGKRPPAEYMAEMQDPGDPQHLPGVLRSHLLPDDLGLPIWDADRFEAFLDARLALIARELNEVTGNVQ